MIFLFNSSRLVSELGILFQLTFFFCKFWIELVIRGVDPKMIALGNFSEHPNQKYRMTMLATKIDG